LGFTGSLIDYLAMPLERKLLLVSLIAWLDLLSRSGDVNTRHF